eukprot:14680644-Alexandrium_andersonii.AAC.1
MESDLPELREADIRGIDVDDGDDDDDAGVGITNAAMPGKRGACCKYPELVCADAVLSLIHISEPTRLALI